MITKSISRDEFEDQEQRSLLSLEINLGMAAQFLSVLSEGEDVSFQTFDDTKQKDRALARIFHGTLDEHAPQLIDLNQRGAGVFVTVNQTDLKGRQAHNITQVRAVFVDLDGSPLGPILSAPIAPHMIIESSPQRYHAYWLIDDLANDHFGHVQKALSRLFNSDPKVHDLPRVMRLPGFIHQKGVPFQTRIFEMAAGSPLKALNFLAAFKILDKPNELISSILQKENAVLSALKERSLFIKNGSTRGGSIIRCPWSDAHTNSEHKEAHYFEPHTNGYAGHGFKCFHRHCEKRNSEDLLIWLGINSKSESLKNDEWETPIPLPEGLPPVAKFEADMLPEVLRDWISDIAERMQIPPDFSAAAAIVVLSSLIGRKVGICPKKHDDWLVVPNLWGAVVGRPSLLKSPAISEVMKPLDHLVAAASKKFDQDIENYEIQEMGAKAIKEAFQSKLNKEAKKNWF